MRAQAAKLDSDGREPTMTATDERGRSATRTPSTSRRSPAGCASTRRRSATTWSARRRCASSRAAPRTSPTCCATPTGDLILRRPPAGVKAKGAHDMGREFRIQVGAARRSSRTSPRWSAFCADESVIGSDFYVMEKLDGTILRRDLPFDADRPSEVSPPVRATPSTS